MFQTTEEGQVSLEALVRSPGVPECLQSHKAKGVSIYCKLKLVVRGEEHSHHGRCKLLSHHECEVGKNVFLLYGR